MRADEVVVHSENGVPCPAVRRGGPHGIARLRVETDRHDTERTRTLSCVPVLGCCCCCCSGEVGHAHTPQLERCHKSNNCILCGR